jgi:hypothetical protein
VLVAAAVADMSLRISSQGGLAWGGTSRQSTPLGSKDQSAANRGSHSRGQFSGRTQRSA